MARLVEPSSVGPTCIGMAGERLAKLLARAGVASRREVERMIADGRVARDGVLVDTPATLLTSLDGVTVDGTPVARPDAARLFLYHKPTGLLVTERDPRGRPTIYDRLPISPRGDLPRVVPVGRLDLATEGLLLLTTDGGLKRELELPATGVERAYRARAYGHVSQPQLEALMDGVEIEGVRYGPINANLERRTGANTWIELILTEGKNREVRRVLEHLGLQVGRLIRTRYGPFVLGDLPPGEVGEVRQADLIAFRQTLGGKRQPSDERIAVSPPAKPARSLTRAPARPAITQAALPGGGRSTVPVRSDRDAPTLVARGGTHRASTAIVSSPSRARPPTGVSARSQSRQSASELDPRFRRGGAQGKRNPDKANGDPRAPAQSTKGRETGELAAPRPAHIERKTGWAKPKPKTGPRRPRKS